ncbi:MAG: hypothetical protein BHV66_03340 [Alistipes putredinis]|uniref:Uncharacterized protein n=1 Tax=Alistipes putredinis TaxID=28117 RepID=A0A1Q6F9T6_9BACT|nr:MAG: hypothetical protein BHV66_03340 [Alistipes putredinis]
MQALRPFLSFVAIKIESIFVKNKKNLSKINKILPPPDRSVERGILCGNIIGKTRCDEVQNQMRLLEG